MIISYSVPKIWRVTDVIFIFHFGPIFAFLPLQQPEKSKFQKNEKKKQTNKKKQQQQQQQNWRYHHLTQVYQKS